MSFLKNIIKKIIFREKASSDTYIEYLRKIGCIIGENTTIYSPRKGFIDDTRPFLIEIGNNEKLFDIEKIIEWYKNLKITSKEIREYSKNFSWDIQMKKVVDYLKEGK